MKKMKILVVIALFFLNNIIAQSQQGIVIYKKSIERKIPTEKDKKASNFNKFQRVKKSIDKLLKNIEFELKFNVKESFFAVIPSLALEESRWGKLALAGYGNNKFYNAKNERLSEENIFGEDFLISNEQLNWQLKNETKKIGDYLCYKAIAIEKKMYRGKMKEYPVIAWYCPEISSFFGPIGVAGLPGLILEVNKGNTKYMATKINLNPKKNIKITKLTKGKKITRKKLGEMISEAMGNFKKNKGY
ncbi:GLPGLI family protein [Tenacibaculum finnmarkense]|uniref:GLPGLI family protein n=1 Tax=Tenacibaculum finnmarkense TaxID=2781243 RepID=UPI001E3A0DD8|nr:GLPGLI family protein [Tenacibaculum finnmarkense]MCD8400995.1 GLPGLI family protein [Tenacibaculum finnmarkense genomovar ulcerans]MCG8786248.1 GLPGLI family protein [Tenacibaculum finnmarkense]MCG8813799.1 GLPGLI family protein [Tenacibaculum finnmarkense]